MKEKKDLMKILEGRCTGYGSEYTAFKKANESKSIGTASQIYDPVSRRIVDTLSAGESRYFWILRFDEDVAEIKEQMIMHPLYVKMICNKHGFRVPSRILTTDFLVLYKDGRIIAYSIKEKNEVLYDENFSEERYKKWEKLVIRQTIEKEHWEKLGVSFKLILSEDINRYKSSNIKQVMRCYDAKNVSTPDQMYRYLIAHRHLDVDMENGFIPFGEIARKKEAEIRALYEERMMINGR